MKFRGAANPGCRRLFSRRLDALESASAGKIACLTSMPPDFCGYATLDVGVLPIWTLRAGVGVLYFCAERV
jgi:hypothetical protein